MTANPPAVNASAIPRKPRIRKPPKPSKTRSPEQAIRLTVRADGSFVPTDEASRRLCKDRGMRIGKNYITYFYEPRDEKQWATAHAVAGILAANVDEFTGMDSHAVLKRIQTDANVLMDTEVIDLGKLGKVTRSVPQSLAFGFLDQTRFNEAWRQMCEYVVSRYFGMIDANAVDELLKLMPMEPSA